jgi:GDP-D-mannose dehydratase
VTWARQVPGVDRGLKMGNLESLQSSFYFKTLVKAMHHWIRKGNADKAALRAREAAHVFNIMDRRGWVEDEYSKAA